MKTIGEFTVTNELTVTIGHDPNGFWWLCTHGDMPSWCIPPIEDYDGDPVDEYTIVQTGPFVTREEAEDDALHTFDPEA